jgi:hypothetical protein
LPPAGEARDGLPPKAIRVRNAAASASMASRAEQIVVVHRPEPSRG